jgi:hypothetical protein
MSTTSSDTAYGDQDGNARTAMDTVKALHSDELASLTVNDKIQKGTPETFQHLLLKTLRGYIIFLTTTWWHSVLAFFAPKMSQSFHAWSDLLMLRIHLSSSLGPRIYVLVRICSFHHYVSQAIQRLVTGQRWSYSSILMVFCVVAHIPLCVWMFERWAHMEADDLSLVNACECHMVISSRGSTDKRSLPQAI